MMEFAHPPEHCHDVASFNTMEVRPLDKPEQNAVKHHKFCPPFDAPPRLAVGLNWLDIDQGANIRVSAFADNITETGADIHIDTWADTTLYAAGCTWFTASDRDPDFQVGQFGTGEDHPWDDPKQKTSRRINFARPYAAPPVVVVWLNNLDIDRNHNYRVVASATDIDAEGFTIHLDTWADTTLHGAAAAWIAYPANKHGVVSGTYGTGDIRPWDQPRLNNSSRVDFPAGKLHHTPTVLIGLSSLDIGFHKNLRLKLSACSVSKHGMNWHIDGWDDTVLYGAGASYIAFN